MHPFSLTALPVRRVEEEAMDEFVSRTAIRLSLNELVCRKAVAAFWRFSTLATASTRLFGGSCSVVSCVGAAENFRHGTYMDNVQAHTIHPPIHPPLEDSKRSDNCLVLAKAEAHPQGCFS